MTIVRPLFLTFTLFIISCCTIWAQINCERNARFGEVEFCLPIIEGMKECYLIPNVKALADGTEAPANLVLGFYINNLTFSKVDSLGHVAFEDYCKVYGTIEIENIVVDKVMLEEMRQMIKANFIVQNWDERVGDWNVSELSVEIGAPTVLKDYSHNDRSWTLLMLVKYEIENHSSHVMAMSMSGVLINNRLIWLAYYLNFEDEETLFTLEKKTNDVLDLLINQNK